MPTIHTKALVTLLFATFAAAGCGHSEDEWQAQLAKYGKLDAEHRSSAGRLEKELAEAKARVDELTRQLQAAGVDIGKLNENLQASSTQVSKLSSTLEEREKALADFRARAKQLEAIKARFELLRKKLEQLTKLGLAVNIRRNRMVISLPGDVLFDSGKETLRKEGQDILNKVASVIRADPSLVSRDYQVAGHTDSRPYGGNFRDNWGLSVMRAREVLLYLIGSGGQLPTRHWSAAGYADTDPVANNDSDDGRQKNRRCDLVVLPSVEEMLDLKSIAQ